MKIMIVGTGYNFNFVFKRLKGLVVKSILNYKNSDSYFVFVSNILLKLNNKNHRFEKSNLGDLFPKFKIVDLLSNQFKFFNYRKQGLMAFENGIAERGINQDTTAPQVLNYLINSGFEIIRVNGDRFVFLLKNKYFNN